METKFPDKDTEGGTWLYMHLCSDSNSNFTFIYCYFFRLNTLYGVLMECYFLECYQVRILIDAVVIA